MGVFPNWKIFPWNFYRSFFFLIFHCIQLKYHLNQIFYDIPIIREIIHYPVKAKKIFFLKKIFKICQKCVVMCILDILFRQITTIIKVCVAFVFGLQTQLYDKKLYLKYIPILSSTRWVLKNEFPFGAHHCWSFILAVQTSNK